jgi:mRNA interferase MazF
MILRFSIQRTGRDKMPYRWSVFLADLDPVVGSEQGKRRPVLVISQEEVNQLLPVVNVLPITARKPGRRVYPNEALVPMGTAGLDSESIVLCFQIRTLDKQRLTRYIGEVTDTELQKRIFQALAFQLGIG